MRPARALISSVVDMPRSYAHRGAATVRLTVLLGSCTPADRPPPESGGSDAPLERGVLAGHPDELPPLEPERVPECLLRRALLATLQQRVLEHRQLLDAAVNLSADTGPGERLDPRPAERSTKRGRRHLVLVELVTGARRRHRCRA